MSSSTPCRPRMVRRSDAWRRKARRCGPPSTSLPSWTTWSTSSRRTCRARIAAWWWSRTDRRSPSVMGPRSSSNSSASDWATESSGRCGRRACARPPRTGRSCWRRSCAATRARTSTPRSASSPRGTWPPVSARGKAVGTHGARATPGSLPPPGTCRWTSLRCAWRLPRRAPSTCRAAHRASRCPSSRGRARTARGCTCWWRR
jgi:hypothetical protein